MTHHNPLIEGLKLPGRIFKLPSQGLFYKNGELADYVKEGEVHVRALSAFDEIMIKNPDQLFSGSAIQHVLSTCVEGIEKPGELLSKDVDALMVFLRSVTYGDTYDLTVNHKCENAKNHDYSISVESFISGMKCIDPTTVEKAFTVVLQNGQVVKLRPNRYSEILELVKNNSIKKEMTPEDKREYLLSMLLGVIESVDGIQDRQMIKEWVLKLPTKMIDKIADKIEGVNDWGISTAVKIKCKDCGEEFEVIVPLNPVSFFTE